MDMECLCKHCKQTFPLTLMKGNTCRICYQIIEVSLKGAKKRAKNHAEEYKCSYKLDEGWIHEQLFKQDYKCWWTGQDFDYSPPIIAGQANPNVVSIDRLNNEEGYTKENSVLCVNWFNRFKSKYTIPELNHILMGCVSAYAKLQQYLVPFSSQPINQVVEQKEYRELFKLPLTEAEKEKILEKLENGDYDKLRDKNKKDEEKRKEEGVKRLYEDITNSPPE
ncbi:hypothetical protein [Bacillus nitratireducens]|uniref:hypothetical protein n=1 Tax=Bacillus nitratireducens TaxID=2026193 RepID=UPI000BEE4042|nr:hypothetical protein [Bacillus nitratireducens]PEE14799.1 hypothetical protein CON53_28025 [Bacillus cereus]MED0906775.1 hypothetical protein [Bacillus nitratireducens]PFH88479.1 hypothetical protein COI81_13400 [Bacillus cereus]PFM56449.1 hypothetical protein COJ52_18355 [Bacillus cereus]PGS30007.1 hypothetical protein COC55_04250 [Bacillus cereus]